MKSKKEMKALKRKLVARVIAVVMVAALALGTVLMFVGCGDSESSDASTETTAEDKESSVENSIGIQGADYEGKAEQEAVSKVTLGKYKGVVVDYDDGSNASQEELFSYADNELLMGANGFFRNDEKTVVGENDIVNVDYQGLLDGVPFSGGTAEDVFIDVAGNSDAASGNGYIPGFTDGLVGAEVGSVVDSPVTFPESYDTADLAGKDVIFKFTINYICDVMTAETMTDDYAMANYDCTAEEFRTVYLPNEYKKYKTTAKDQIIRESVVNQILDGSEIDPSVEEYLKSEYVFLAIASKEGLEFDKDGFERFAQNYAAGSGFTDLEEFYTAYGSKAELEDFYMALKATDFCIENAVIE